MIIATDPKRVCLNDGCMAELSFDTDHGDFVCGQGHRFPNLDQPEPVFSSRKPTAREIEKGLELEPLAVEILKKAELEAPPVEVPEAIPVRPAATEKRPEEVKATGIPVRRSAPKPKEFGDENGNRWLELPNGNVLATILIEQHNASNLRATVEGGQWAGGDPLRYLVETVTSGFENGLFW